MYKFKIFNQLKAFFFVLLFLKTSLAVATSLDAQCDFFPHHARDWDDWFDEDWWPSDDSGGNEDKKEDDDKNKNGEDREKNVSQDSTYDDPGLSDDEDPD